MEFEDIEIGLLNEHASVPDQGEVLARFQGGLEERLRGEPDIHAVEENTPNPDDISADAELEESENHEGDGEQPSGSNDGEPDVVSDEYDESEGTSDSGEDLGVTAEETDIDDESGAINEDQAEPAEAGDVEVAESDETLADEEIENEEPEKDYSDEWTPEELAELGEAADE